MNFDKMLPLSTNRQFHKLSVGNLYIILIYGKKWLFEKEKIQLSIFNQFINENEFNQRF